jgi:AcrR family transcriptional regulator
MSDGTDHEFAPEARERILDAAEELFAADGFDATPTARIAAAAGVPKGLLFYYFPKKIDLLRSLLAERLPTEPLCTLDGVVRAGDIAGSLLRLARALDLGGHASQVMRTIIFRESSTHPEVGEHIRLLRQALLDLTERVIVESSPARITAALRRRGAQTFVAVIFDEANARRFDGLVPDVAGAAEVVASAVSAK